LAYTFSVGEAGCARLLLFVIDVESWSFDDVESTTRLEILFVDWLESVALINIDDPVVFDVDVAAVWLVNNVGIKFYAFQEEEKKETHTHMISMNYLRYFLASKIIY